MTGMHFDWTDERIEQLKKWWEEGYAATEIAAIFGTVTRNAVLGKIHRLKLPLRHEPRKDKHRKNSINAAVKRRSPAARWRRDGMALKLFDTTTGDVPELATDHCPNPISILELTGAVCHWPASGEGANTVFCGDQAIGRFPYCLHHCRIAYRAPEPRRSKAEIELAQRNIRLTA